MWGRGNAGNQQNQIPHYETSKACIVLRLCRLTSFPLNLYGNVWWILLISNQLFSIVAVIIPNSDINFNLCCASTLQVPVLPWPHLGFLVTAKINYKLISLYFRLLSWSPFHFFLPPPLPLFFPFFHHVLTPSPTITHLACIPTLAFILPIFHLCLYLACILHSTFIWPSPPLIYFIYLLQFLLWRPFCLLLTTLWVPLPSRPLWKCSASFFVLLISPSIIFADYFGIDLSEIPILWQWSLTKWKLHKRVGFPHNSFQICTEHVILHKNPNQRNIR